MTDAKVSITAVLEFKGKDTNQDNQLRAKLVDNKKQIRILFYLNTVKMAHIICMNATNILQDERITLKNSLIL